MQLDIFDDSRDVMLRNDVVHALQARHAASARSAWRALLEEFPADAGVMPLDILVATLEVPPAPRFTTHDEARDARRALVDRIEPAARSAFGTPAGTAWLQPLWADLARRAEWLPFHAEHAEIHAAPLWLRAGDAPSALSAVAGIESWRRIPAPLAWMAEARHRTEGLEAAWPLLAELAWLSPARFDSLSRRLNEPPLDKVRKAFDASFEGVGQPDDLAWFPAWLLTEKPGLARWLGLAQPGLGTPAEQGLRLMLDLLTLERQGRHADVIDRRKRLRGLHASLYQAYLRTR